MDKTHVNSGLILTEARSLLRKSIIGCLATLQDPGGGPYASLITVATAIDGSPLFLISTLAWHTRNLLADSRASVMVSEAAASGDPLDVGRVSLTGIAEKVDSAAASPRFLARHPNTAFYAGFADFSFWRLRVDTAHYVGGFGRITTFSAAEFLLGGADAALWEAASDKFVAALNDRHGDLIQHLARARRPASKGPWRVAACDPHGCDLILEDEPLRLDFGVPATAPDRIPEALEALTVNQSVN
jgi:putative heme iron utilization protein